VGKYNDQENDKYLLENNLLGVKTIEELEEAEAFAFSLRAAQLERTENVIDSFTEEHFKKLHYHLFQDIYPFAGQFRDVQLMKGNTRFCQAQYISTYSSDLFNQLNKESMWNSLDEAANRLAYFKSELNMLHPFREGNGRIIRIFIRAFALSKGVQWEYENIDRDVYIQAMIQSVTNTEALKKLLLETLVSSTNDHDSKE
jgi:cell filamentation protein